MQNSADVLNQLRDFQTKRRKPQDILADEETKLGLPSAQQRLTGLRSAIGNTENLLRSVDPSVTGRTAGTFTTEAQRSRLVAKEREPISEQFREQSRSLEGETATTADIANRAMKAAQLGLSDLDTQENSLRTLYGSLYQREQDEAARQERERASRAAAAAQDAYLKYIQQQAQQGRAQQAVPQIQPRNAATNSAGQILGYDEYNPATGWGLSRQTDQGWKEQDDQMGWQRAAQSPIGKYGPLALLGGGWLWGK